MSLCNGYVLFPPKGVEHFGDALVILNVKEDLSLSDGSLIFGS